MAALADVLLDPPLVAGVASLCDGLGCLSQSILLGECPGLDCSCTGLRAALLGLTVGVESAVAVSTGGSESLSESCATAPVSPPNVFSDGGRRVTRGGNDTTPVPLLVTSGCSSPRTVPMCPSANDCGSAVPVRFPWGDSRRRAWEAALESPLVGVRTARDVGHLDGPLPWEELPPELVGPWLGFMQIPFRCISFTAASTTASLAITNVFSLSTCRINTKAASRSEHNYLLVSNTPLQSA